MRKSDMRHDNWPGVQNNKMIFLMFDFFYYFLNLRTTTEHAKYIHQSYRLHILQITSVDLHTAMLSFLI